MTFLRALGAAACVLALAGAPAAAQDQRKDTVTKDTVTTTGKPKTGPVTWDRIAGNWKLFRGKIRKQWGKLTKDDIALANGRREELAGRIQARYGIDKAQADAQVDAWMKAQK
jgi:uncharacterized protein YjbJ (UPF0337 family)